MKLLVIGATGMLGHKLFQKLGTVFPETYATVLEDMAEPPFVNIPFLQTDKVFRNIDVTEFEALGRMILALRPNYIINCVGVIKQQKAKVDQASLCIQLNSMLPHQLVEVASQYGGRVIHFSTDCVFDGSRGRYSEEDRPDAMDRYGRSKALGEVICDNALTLRTSIIGRELVNHLSLLDWFLQQQGKRIHGFTGAIYSGVTTNQMAKVVQLVIEEHPMLSGLYHIVAEPISKYNLLALARTIFDLECDIEADTEFVLDRSMVGDKFKSVTGYESPSWDQLLRDVASETELYQSWGVEL